MQKGGVGVQIYQSHTCCKYRYFLEPHMTTLIDTCTYMYSFHTTTASHVKLTAVT